MAHQRTSKPNSFEPFVLGDRPYKRGSRVLSRTAKESRVRRGAFPTWECDIYSANHVLTAQMRTSLYYYYVSCATYASLEQGGSHA